MNFVPRMNNRIGGYTVERYFHRRYWNGMAADLWDVTCAPGAGGFYSARDPRLFVALAADGGSDALFEMREIGGDSRARSVAPFISFIPAGMDIEAYSHGIRSVRHLDLHFDADTLERRLGADYAAAAFQRPRLMMSEPQLFALSELLAQECLADEPLHDLYGDGLALSLLLAVMKLPASERRMGGKLAQWQLRQVTDFIEDNCLRTIRLDELATIAGLSACYFSHAFKASTGLPPHQWQMRARIRRVKARLIETRQPLAEIAAEMGFSDAAHLTRMFRRHVGSPPSVWRRDQAD
ncbi:AraC family transcriptional regulator [Rhizobium sp. G21]|uniref:helix-turn-helix domain-containing protein n=1 Tax=Rhizobium sp. G21 TaxID=2758439 RepID=UPI001601212F|nr:AraC family transcriptional regulator [Rhizobium sp. G21]MBB1250753.1 helix-turn-helix transcriptional regulator [Rhizobium sp. G21]